MTLDSDLEGKIVDCFPYMTYSKEAAALLSQMVGCGPSALAAALPQVSPFDLYAECAELTDDGDEGTSLKTMLTVLNRHGVETIPLTSDNMCHDDYIVDRIKPGHVILVDQQCTRNESSWLVIWNNTEIHNFCARSLTLNSYLSRPDGPYRSKHILYKPEWQLGTAMKAALVANMTAKKGKPSKKYKSSLSKLPIEDKGALADLTTLNSLMSCGTRFDELIGDLTAAGMDIPLFGGLYLEEELNVLKEAINKAKERVKQIKDIPPETLLKLITAA